MKKAFSLVELLVVIGIIGVLAGVLLGTFSGAGESAKAAKCLTNMRNLGMAVQNYGMAAQEYPSAKSSEYSKPDVSRGLAQAKLKYNEHVGWISWYSKGLYPSDSSQKGSCREISMYSDVLEDYEYALHHGALYRSAGNNESIYVCPSHLSAKKHVNWSYLMNPKVGGKGFGSFAKADRTLLFCEVPFKKGSPGEWFPEGTGSDDATDAALQYEEETIGCNHKSGRYWTAHVVFADGHAEKLRATGKQGKDLTGSDLKELTQWLCEGTDVSFNGERYEKLD